MQRRRSRRGRDAEALELGRFRSSMNSSEGLPESFRSCVGPPPKPSRPSSRIAIPENARADRPAAHESRVCRLLVVQVVGPLPDQLESGSRVRRMWAFYGRSGSRSPRTSPGISSPARLSRRRATARRTDWELLRPPPRPDRPDRERQHGLSRPVAHVRPVPQSSDGEVDAGPVLRNGQTCSLASGSRTAAPGRRCCHGLIRGDIRHPRTGAVMPPEPLDAKPLRSPTAATVVRIRRLAGPEGQPVFRPRDRQQGLENFFSRGLIDPEDDLRATNRRAMSRSWTPSSPTSSRMAMT